VPLKDEQIKKWLKEDIKKFFKFNENESTIHQNLWDTAKAMLTRRL
jgi:hypothetical protein